MKLEVGRYYRTRDGYKVKCEERDTSSDTEFPFLFSDGAWRTECGMYWGESRETGDDLIAEWTDTPEVGTLREIGAQAGDVVECVVAQTRAFTEGRRYPVSLNGSETSIEYDNGGPCTNTSSQFRIISRASDAKPTGPVITETVTRNRIVPGVYGKVKISEPRRDGRVYISLSNGSNAEHAYAMSRADLIAARDVFNQLIDAMPGE